MDQEDYQRDSVKEYRDTIKAAYEKLSSSQVAQDAASYINSKARGEGDESIPLKAMMAQREFLRAKATLEHAEGLYQESLEQSSLAREHYQAESKANIAYWNLSADVTKQSAKRTR